MKTKKLISMKLLNVLPMFTNILPKLLHSSKRPPETVHEQFEFLKNQYNKALKNWAQHEKTLKQGEKFLEPEKKKTAENKGKAIKAVLDQTKENLKIFGKRHIGYNHLVNDMFRDRLSNIFEGEEENVDSIKSSASGGQTESNPLKPALSAVSEFEDWVSEQETLDRGNRETLKDFEPIKITNEKAFREDIIKAVQELSADYVDTVPVNGHSLAEFMPVVSQYLKPGFFQTDFPLKNAMDVYKPPPAFNGSQKKNYGLITYTFSENDKLVLYTRNRMWFHTDFDNQFSALNVLQSKELFLNLSKCSKSDAVEKRLEDAEISSELPKNRILKDFIAYVLLLRLKNSFTKGIAAELLANFTKFSVGQIDSYIQTPELLQNAFHDSHNGFLDVAEHVVDKAIQHRSLTFATNADN
eukprot:Platyproteum_vivax@DN16463_c0_g1_i1.p1